MLVCIFSIKTKTKRNAPTHTRQVASCELGHFFLALQIHIAGFGCAYMTYPRCDDMRREAKRVVDLWTL